MFRIDASMSRTTSSVPPQFHPSQAQSLHHVGLWSRSAAVLCL